MIKIRANVNSKLTGITDSLGARLLRCQKIYETFCLWQIDTTFLAWSAWQYVSETLTVSIPFGQTCSSPP